MSVHLASSGDYLTIPLAANASISGTGGQAGGLGWYRGVIARSTSSNTNATLFANGSTVGAPQSFSLGLSSTYINTWVVTSTGSIAPAKSGDVVIPADGQWRLYLLQVEPFTFYAGSGLTAANICKIYVVQLNGGVRWSMGYVSGAVGGLNSNTPMQVGGQPGSSAANFIGDVYMAFGGKGALTPMQMNAIMSGVDPSSVANLPAPIDFEYKFNGLGNLGAGVSTGTILADNSTNGYTATIASTSMTVVADPVFTAGTVTVNQPIQVNQRKPGGAPNLITLTGSYTGAAPTGVDAQVESFGCSLYCRVGAVAGQSEIIISNPSNAQAYGSPIVGAIVTCGSPGQYFPTGTVVTSYNPATLTITLSNALTAALPTFIYVHGNGGIATQAMTTATSASGQAVLTAASSYVYPGMTANLPISIAAAGTKVVAVSATTITLSNPLLVTVPMGQMITFGAGSIVTPWQTVTTTPANGAWSGSISGVPQGGPYLVRVRPTGGAANAITSICWTPTGVGMVIALAGQSLMAQPQVLASTGPAIDPTGYNPNISYLLNWPGNALGGGGLGGVGMGVKAMIYNLAAAYPSMPIMIVGAAVGGTGLIASIAQQTWTTTAAAVLGATTVSAVPGNPSVSAQVGEQVMPSPYFGGLTRLTAVPTNSLTFAPGLQADMPSGTAVTLGGVTWLDTVPQGLFAYFSAVIGQAGGDMEYVVWNQGEAEMSVASGVRAVGQAGMLAALNQLHARFYQLVGRTPNTCKMLVEISGTQMNAGAIADANALIVRSGQIAFAEQWAPARYAALQTDWACNNGSVHPFPGYPYTRQCARIAQSIMFHDGHAVPRGIGPKVVSFTGNGATWAVTVRNEGGTGIAFLNADRVPDGLQVSDDGFSTLIPVLAAAVAGTRMTLTLSRAVRAVPQFRYGMAQSVTPYVTCGLNPITTTSGSLSCRLAQTNTLNVGDWFALYVADSIAFVGGINRTALSYHFQAQVGTTASVVVFNAYSPVTASATATGGGSAVWFRPTNYVVDDTAGLANDLIQQGIQLMPTNLLMDTPIVRRRA